MTAPSDKAASAGKAAPQRAAPDRTVRERELVERVYRAKDKQELLAIYKDWAESYDATMLEGLSYVAPRRTAQHLARHLDDKGAAILDLGCGTGLAAQGLADLGYRCLDGLDLSEAMLAVARKRGIYRHLLTGDLTERLPIDEGAYDGAIASGIFTHGHLGADCLDEIVRILKPGGLFACVIREQVFESMGFATKLALLEAAGSIDILSREKEAGYEGSDARDGIYLVLRRATPLQVQAPPPAGAGGSKLTPS